VNVDSRAVTGVIALSPPLVRINAQPQLMIADWDHRRLYVAGAADLVPGSSTMGDAGTIDAESRTATSAEPIKMTPVASANVGVGAGAFDAARQRMVAIDVYKDEA
jgi:hypothetical protein